ncbi:flagellar basal body-associated FliL family protein [Pseudomonas sp.]|uniref:flagellar basal body-associated FliL family protein n=1 Tax=Pseudomonas sp. TaxID=306 RepID=UPI003D0B6E25
MTMQRVILIMLVLNTAIALGCVALTYTMLKPLRSGALVQGDGAASSVEDEATSEYTFFPIQKIIVSLQGENREHYFVLDLVLQADIEADTKKLEQLDPMVRTSAVAHLSSMSFAQLRAMPIAELQVSLETALLQDFSSKKLAVPFDHVLVSKLIVQ